MDLLNSSLNNTDDKILLATDNIEDLNSEYIRDVHQETFENSDVQIQLQQENDKDGNILYRVVPINTQTFKFKSNTTASPVISDVQLSADSQFVTNSMQNANFSKLGTYSNYTMPNLLSHAKQNTCFQYNNNKNETGQFLLMMTPELMQQATYISPQQASMMEDMKEEIKGFKEDKRRSTHNEIERRRRDTINTWITKLAKLVPECDSDQSKHGQSKGGILAKTVNHIIELKKINENLFAALKECEKMNEEIQRLKSTNKDLLSKVAQNNEQHINNNKNNNIFNQDIKNNVKQNKNSNHMELDFVSNNNTENSSYNKKNDTSLNIVKRNSPNISQLKNIINNNNITNNCINNNDISHNISINQVKQSHTIILDNISSISDKPPTLSTSIKSLLQPLTTSSIDISASPITSNSNLTSTTYQNQMNNSISQSQLPKLENSETLNHQAKIMRDVSQENLVLRAFIKQHFPNIEIRIARIDEINHLARINNNHNLINNMNFNNGSNNLLNNNNKVIKVGNLVALKSTELTNKSTTMNNSILQANTPAHMRVIARSSLALLPKEAIDVNSNLLTTLKFQNTKTSKSSQ